MNDRSKQRADTARAHDDSDLIDGSEEGPDQGGRSGGRLQRDIGTQAAIESGIDGKSVTRVRGADKKEDADRPRYNER